MNPVLVTLGVLAWLASLCAVWSGGRAHERVVQEERRRRLASSYVCACTHPFGYHDPTTRACHGYVAGPNEYFGGPIGPRLDPCPCRCYAGDVPAEYILSNALQLPTRVVDRAGNDAG